MGGPSRSERLGEGASKLRERSNLYTGNAGFWAPVTADPELGLFYIPTESATSDYYGGYRPGNNLYANSVVALDAKTGKRAWHFQLTHHDIWDFDPPTAPILADITVDGRPVKAVAQLTKQGFVFVLDRATGKPVWPIEERPVPKSDVPGEWTSPTQPFPTKPAAVELQGVTENDLVDFTPEIKAEALRVARQYRLGGLYTPSSPPNAAEGTLGTLTAPSAVGGVNWPGGAVDPVDDVLFVTSQNTLFRALLSEGSPNTGVLYHDTRGQAVGPAPTVFGLPLLKPPYGRVVAIDLKTGERLWSVPHGNTPEAIRKNPKLQGVEIPNTGAPTRGTGLLVTSTLLFGGGEGGAVPVLRAWDKKRVLSSRRFRYLGRPLDFPSRTQRQAAVHRRGSARGRRRGNRDSRTSGRDGTIGPCRALSQSELMTAVGNGCVRRGVRKIDDSKSSRQEGLAGTRGGRTTISVHRREGPFRTHG